MSKVSCLGTRLLSLCLLLGTGLLPACGDEDLDGDGFTVEQGDCDDDDSAISPAAEELCDGVDNDCDGSIDVDATDASLGYADDDGDGFGDLASPMWSCEAEGVTDATDCDDADADSYPGARETCDGRDNDCDSATDEYADDAVDWYLDYDGDGYGDSEHRVVACDAPTDEYVEVGEDCDDQDPKSYPGAAELCIDGVDTDCDGLADEDDEDACPVFQGWSEQVVSLQDADVSLVGAPVSYLGRSAVAVNVDGDDLQDLLVGAVGDERVYLFLGSTLVSGAELTSDDADYVTGETLRVDGGFKVGMKLSERRGNEHQPRAR